MKEKNLHGKLEEIEIIENFCGLLMERKQKDKCVQCDPRTALKIGRAVIIFKF